MSWNYRLMQRAKRNPKGKGYPDRDRSVEIVECYYDEDGVPAGYAPANLDSAANVTGLRDMLTHALAATYQPVLKHSDCVGDLLKEVK